MKPNIASVAGDFGWQLLCLFLLVDAGSCANCSAVTCFNGGNCNEYTASPHCLCPLPYIAPYCQSAADYCFTLQPDIGITELPVCLNGGNCTLIYTHPYFNCSCPDGYAGIRCNELPAVIDVELCGLYATCTDTSGSYNCTCIDGVQSNGKDNCTDVNKCLSSSKCDANADSINLIGSFDCICKPGFYGNGTVCYPKMLLPTVNATNITDHDIVHAPRGVPFLIGSHESSSFQVSNYGAISFSGYLWYLPYNSTTAKVNFPGAVVAPYWFVYPRTWRGRWTPKLSYELLNSRNHSSSSNWRAVKQIIEQEIRSEFNPLTALIVTWRILTPSLPSRYYWNRFDCVRKCHSRPWNQTNGYISLCLSLCSQAKANASIEFQAVVTRNETHSYAIFNYGDFHLPVPRIFNLSSQKWELTAFSGFTDNFLVRKELPFSLRPDWPELPNLSPGSSGRPGRHVLQLSIGHEGAPECGSWIAAARANQSSSDSPGCSDCPFDFRTAVLDRRYRPYDFECSGGSIRMCFSNTTFKCAQSFTGSSASGCKPENSLRCELENCRQLVSTRCCYRMSSAAAGSEISQLCRRSQSLGNVRAEMRRILFGMPTTGHLISSSPDGAGHVRYFYRNSTNDSIQFGFGSPQYQNELYGLRVCSAAGMMAAYSAVRPVCTSQHYQPPAGDCSSMLCGQYAACTVAPGSYNCTCIDGFQGNGTDNCTDVNECLNSSKCDANADCINLIGSFDCICKPGYYGNGTVCYPQMLLSTVNATNISDYDIVHAPGGVPFLIGSQEISSFQVSNFGAISFSVYLRYLPYNSITAKINFPGAVVAPYWFVKPTPLYYRSDWTPKVCYELLNSSNHSSSSNWRAVKQIIEQKIRSEFNPLTALIVTWRILTPSLPWQSYRNRFDCVSKCYSNQTWNETNGYIDLCRGLCSRAEANASIEFQAVVTRNETHSYAIFNYGDFHLPVPRIFNPSSQIWDLKAFSGFTDNLFVQEELSLSRSPDWPELPNLSPGSSGRPGRHVLQLSIEQNGTSECGSWIAAARANQSSPVFPGCSDCPTDFRTAVLDRRYSPYELECSGDSIRMCFSNTSYQCVQSFTGSSSSGCKPENSWRCELENCRHLVSTRCCYRMSSTDAGSKISQLCRRSQSLGKVRAVLRWIMFDMPPTGHLISSSPDGAGHARYFYRRRTNDSIQFGYGSPQYQSELNGLRVCSAAGMMAAYSTVRPMCTSENYLPPAGGFNRGDPHLSTLSNRSYTFNGHCEYQLLTSERWPNSPTLRLQARTAPVSGGAATAFVGVALKSGLNELAVSVIRNESSDDLDVFSSDGRRIGSVRGELAALSNASRLDSYRLEVPDNSTIDIVDESTGVSVTVTMETSSLRVGVQLDLAGKYPSGLDGLLGNSNASGFRLRNGSVLPANSSERQLFEFGNSWRLNSSEPSYLHYPAGKGRADFCDPSFVPVFAEDFKDNMLALFGGNAGLKNASEEVCRSSGSSYLTCMFDAAQLRSVAAAQDAAVAIRDETRTRVVLANRPPQFVSAPSQLRVNGSNSVGVTFSVTDPDGASPNVTVLEAVGGTAKLEAGTSSSWQLVWQPVDNWQGDIKLQLVAVDEVGAVTVWTPKIVVCDCGSRGRCCPDCGIADDTAYYHREECKCDLGFTGPQCEQAVKICLTSDCQEPQDKGDEEDGRVDDRWSGVFRVGRSVHGRSAFTATVGAVTSLVLLSARLIN
ncbi:hypothetical protein BOX15_Mlig030817g1 [Macrostomum lignano]|uniref:EGF-like domain-containing protein n=1 Tax=Macrostomum lignano TaxID=282301 RepID=A0A267FRS0_9PLAT|nr:hypothetical protein BOX15_Mlig030817g1 [Macrostomum lignano]